MKSNETPLPRVTLKPWVTLAGLVPGCLYAGWRVINTLAAMPLNESLFAVAAHGLRQGLLLALVTFGILLAVVMAASIVDEPRVRRGQMRLFTTTPESKNEN